MLEYKEQNINALKKYCCNEKEYEQLEELIILANLMGYVVKISPEISNNNINAIDLQIKDLIFRLYLFNFKERDMFLLSYKVEIINKINKFINRKNLSFNDYINFIKENL